MQKLFKFSQILCPVFTLDKHDDKQLPFGGQRVLQIDISELEKHYDYALLENYKG